MSIQDHLLLLWFLLLRLMNAYANTSMTTTVGKPSGYSGIAAGGGDIG